MGNLEMFVFDWDRALEAIGMLVLLAFLVERVVALIVEMRAFVIRTKVPGPGSEEAERERKSAEIARQLLDAGDDLEAVQAILKGLRSDSPLWMPNVDSVEEARRRAKRHLEWMDDLHVRRQRLARFPIKECLAFIAASIVCFAWDIDVFSFVLRGDEVELSGKLLTAAVIAGGSKASIRLFHDLLGVRSHAVNEMRAERKKEKP